MLIVVSTVQWTCWNVEVLSNPVHGEDCHSSGMLRQHYDTSPVVSARCTWFSALYRILQGRRHREGFGGQILSPMLSAHSDGEHFQESSRLDHLD